MKKLCIYGYFANNLGDDLMFKSIIENSDYDEYIVLNDGGGITYPINKKIKFISKRSFKKQILKNVFFNFKANRIDLAYVGGSMFMDKGEGKVAREKRKFSLLCKLLGIKTFVVGSNLGPVYNESVYSKNILRFSKFVKNWSVRDKFSHDFLVNLGIKNVKLLPDIVFSTDISKFHTINDKKISISVVNYDRSSGKYDSKNSKRYYEDIVEWANYFNKHGYIIKLLSFENKVDLPIMNQLVEKIPFAKIVEYDGKNILEEIATSEYIIASRFHSAILGALFDKKMVAYSYNNKTKNYLDSKKFKVLEFGEKKDINLFKKFKVTDSEIEASFEYTKRIAIQKNSI